MNYELGASDASFRSPSALTLQNLRYALAAAEHGSFRRAGEVLLLQQSTLSRCVRQLEELDRHGRVRKVERRRARNPRGRQFLRSAQSILEQVEALLTTARSTGRGEAGRLSVGFYTSLTAGNLRATMMEVARRFPQLELEMFEKARALASSRRFVMAWSTLRSFLDPTALPEAKRMPLVERTDSRRRSRRSCARRAEPCSGLI